jgi:hypothetical protein
MGAGSFEVCGWDVDVAFGPHDLARRSPKELRVEASALPRAGGELPER